MIGLLSRLMRPEEKGSRKYPHARRGGRALRSSPSAPKPSIRIEQGYPRLHARQAKFIACSAQLCCSQLNPMATRTHILKVKPSLLQVGFRDGWLYGLGFPIGRGRFMMITGAQCRAARALVEWSRDRLASDSGVDARVIEEFERRIERPAEDVCDKLQAALENAGAAFIAENGGGVGVRLKLNRSEVRRISILENEGGIVGTDDVP